MKTKISLWVCLFLFSSATGFSQTGKYFTATGTTCKGAKVFIDHRILDYCGTEFTVDWSGNCKDGFAEGNGTLTIISKKLNRSFTITYEGMLSKGKKNGNGTLHQYLFYPSMNPYCYYSGSFKNDEFDGYGEYRSEYPYPIDPDDLGKGISMESLALGSPIWRSDLFFYTFKGNFTGGKIGDTENAIGKTKKMGLIGKLVEYKGAVKNGRPNGQGTATEVTVKALMRGQSWASATGNFINGRLNGYGKEVDIMSEYEGEFIDGLRNGKGKLTFYDIDYSSNDGRKISLVMDANFKDGLADGFCTIYYQNSAAYKYTGPVKNGSLEGTGEIEFLDGSKLRGNFKNGKMEGEGAITFANGDKFSGIYSNDKPTRGTLYYLSGAKYEGEMSIREEKNKTTGKPIQVYIRQGSGVYTDKDGSRYNVKCTNNECTKTE